MRRLVTVAVVGMALVAAMSVPALAKGENGEGLGAESVAIVGPGLAGPVTLGGDQAANYGELSRVFSNGKMTERPTQLRLGPAYDVLYTIDCMSPGGAGNSVGARNVLSYHQVLYPYATFGDFTRPWTYTPAGQPACGFISAPMAGWMATSTDLTPALVGAGLPATAPDLPAAPAPVPSPDGIPVWVFAIVAAMVATGAVSFGLLSQAQRRRATA
jgi:hypothetical protein